MKTALLSGKTLAILVAADIVLCIVMVGRAHSHIGNDLAKLDVITIYRYSWPVPAIPYLILGILTSILASLKLMKVGRNGKG